MLKINWLEVAETGTTAMPLIVIVLDLTVVLKLTPEIITLVPSLPEDGEKEEIIGSLIIGNWDSFLLQLIKKQIRKIII
jgi:hypothetical protein